MDIIARCVPNGRITELFRKDYTRKVSQRTGEDLARISCRLNFSEDFGTTFNLKYIYIYTYLYLYLTSNYLRLYIS